MIVAILIMTTLTALNTFFIFAVLLTMYGKLNDIIESREKQAEAISQIVKGIIDSIYKSKN